MDIQTIQTAVIQLVLSIVSTAVISAIGIATTWLLQKLGKRADAQTTRIALFELSDAVQKTVGELEQLFVEKMKKDNGGKLTPDNIKQLGELLVTSVREKLTVPTIALLEAAGTDINARIHGEAEALINEMRKKPPDEAA